MTTAAMSLLMNNEELIMKNVIQLIISNFSI